MNTIKRSITGKLLECVYLSNQLAPGALELYYKASIAFPDSSTIALVSLIEKAEELIKVSGVTIDDAIALLKKEKTAY